MEALTKDIQPEFRAWRSTRPSLCAHGHPKLGLGELVAGLALCLEGPGTGLAGTQGASGDTLYVLSCKGTTEGPAPDPRPGSWPVLSTGLSEDPGVAFDGTPWGVTAPTPTAGRH